jgi:hypothetical protein
MQANIRNRMSDNQVNRKVTDDVSSIGSQDSLDNDEPMPTDPQLTGNSNNLTNIWTIHQQIQK